MFPFFRKPAGGASASDGPARARASDKRKHYRVRRSSMQALSVRMIDSRGAKFPCDCEDLCLGGTALSFPAEKAPPVRKGQLLLLEFHAVARDKAVRVKGRVVEVVSTATRLRCGLVFDEPGELAPQLDGFYARFFNRRRHVRVLPDLSARLKVELRWPAECVEVQAHDLSVSGIGLALSASEVERLGQALQFDLSFRLPKGEAVIQARARRVGLRVLARGAILGLEFLPEGGIEKHRAALESYVEARVAEMSRWNAAAERKAG